MRTFLLIAASLLAFGATMAFTSTDANAVVCARGVYRAGCAGYRGAVVVRPMSPTPAGLAIGAGERCLRTALLLTLEP
jgi:hypothetical protein